PARRKACGTRPRPSEGDFVPLPTVVARLTACSSLPPPRNRRRQSRRSERKNNGQLISAGRQFFSRTAATAGSLPRYVISRGARGRQGRARALPAQSGPGGRQREKS